MIALLAGFGILLLRLALIAIGLGVILRMCGLLLRETLRERHLASRREIAKGSGWLEGDQGLLRGSGCLLGARRRRAWSEIDYLRAPWGRTLLLGAPDHIEHAIRAALNDWRGALVYVDSQGGSKYLNRQDVVRFAPGRIDGACYNPMLAIRRGIHAWTDAKILAAALLTDTRGAAIETLAALILDQLHTAPVEERNLTGLRRRLFDPEGAFAALHHNVHEATAPPGEWVQHPEVMRLSRYLDGNPENFSKAWRASFDALNVFSDGRVQCATNQHQIDLGALMMEDNPSTLVVELPFSDQKSMGPIVAAVLAQLVTNCTEARATDSRGRPVTRPILLVIDEVAALPFVPLLKRRLRAAQDCDLYVLIAAQDIADVTRPFGMESLATGDEVMRQFDGVAAIGPQRSATARMLSAAAGIFGWFRWVRREPYSWKDWVLPCFEIIDRPVLPIEDFQGAGACGAHLFIKGFKPVRCGGFLADRGKPLEIAPSELAQVAHDWSAAPVPQPDMIIIEPVHEAPQQKPRQRADEPGSMQGELSLSNGNAPSDIAVRVPRSQQLRKMFNAQRPGGRRT